LAALQAGLAGCPQAADMAAALVDWQRYRRNRKLALYSFYGTAFAGIPGKKAREALAVAQAAAAACGG
jgi:hypothetical protein